MKEIFNKKNLPLLILMLLTAIGITATTIIFDQSFFMVSPLYVSLFIFLLQTRVNRFALLLASINSVTYAVVYFYYGLYANAVYTLLFNAPLSIISFIRWSKNSYGSSTILRKLSWKQRLYTFLGFVAVSASIVAILSMLGSDYALLDTITSLLGILGIILTMFAFIEYTVISLISGVTNIVLYIQMVVNGNLVQMPYLIFMFYSLICVCFSVARAKKLYDKQKAEMSL